MNYLYLGMILFLIIIIIFLIKNQTVNASQGGILEGKSHEQGGIKTRIMGIQRDISVQGNEDVLTSNVNVLTGTYNCIGTPKGIASAINVLGGGVSFSNDGKCYQV